MKDIPLESLTGFMRLNVACPRSVLEKALGQLKEDAVDALENKIQYNLKQCNLKTI